MTYFYLNVKTPIDQLLNKKVMGQNNNLNIRVQNICTSVVKGNLKKVTFNLTRVIFFQKMCNLTCKSSYTSVCILK